MSGLILAALLSQGWHSVVVDEGSGFSIPYGYGFLVDSMGYPVIVYSEGIDKDKFVRWNGTGWDTVYLPRQGSDHFLEGQYWLDSRGWLHWGADTLLQEEVRLLDYYFDGVAWDSLYYIDTVSNYWGPYVGFVLDSLDQPHFFRSGDFSWPTYYIRKDEDSWLKDTICQADSGFPQWNHRAFMGPRGKPRFTYYWGLRILKYCYLSEFGWVSETVEELDNYEAEFAMTTCWLYCDDRGNPYVLYAPYYYGQGYRGKFAWRDSSGTWHKEYMDTLGFRYGKLVVDTARTIHISFADSTGIYHYTRHLPDTAWLRGERIDTFTDAVPTGMTMDKDGYFHLVFLANSWKKLVYATTRPGVGTTELPQEPEPSLVLIPASQGFYITGYEGEARIYDPAGRLILSGEINGKTLIGPLRPGVYFVVAGREKARVAIR